MGMEIRFSFLIRLVAVLAAGTLAACRPEAILPEEGQAVPDSWVELVNAYEAGKEYVGTTVASSFAKVFFVGASVVVSRSDFVVEDCRGGAEPKAVSYDHATGMWLLDGTSSGVSRTNGAAAESLPVYVYFNEKELVLHASNGDVLRFDNVYYEPPSPDPGPDPDPPVPEIPYEIPRVYLTTQGQAPVVDKENYVPGTIRVLDPSCTFADTAVFEAPMKIRGRGNSTWGMPKKPYKIKLEEKQSILGMPKDKEWCVLANYADKSLLRNILSMEISRRLGFRWTPRMVSVELWFNGAYQGVYSFSEHKKVSKDRVNIDVATAENNSGEGLTGGFYLEFENETIDEPCWFKTDRYGVTLMFHEPEQPTAEQQAWMRQYLNDFETTLWSLGHTDRGPTNYADYIDVRSFVNYYILEELAKNPDANFRKSTFLTKERGKKAEIYHVWDFDLTFGNCNYWGNGLLPRDFLLKNLVWYDRLFNKDRDWVEAVKARWNEMYDSLATIPEYIDEQVKLLDGSQERNFQRWQILGVYVWPNAVWYNSYEEEIEYLKTFYLQRLYWLNEEINRL